jgi:Tol biopolymer transport system component
LIIGGSLMAGRKMNTLGTMGLLVAIMSLSSCAQQLANFDFAPAGGFVSEIDEPSARGTLSRTTPSDIETYWSFDVSRDGASVVFSGRQRDSDGPYQLFRLDSGSANPVKLSAGGTEDCLSPSFTADGKYIVYESSGSFWKMPRDGAGARTLVPGSGVRGTFIDQTPHVSSTGRVVFATLDQITFKSLIWTVGLDGSDLTQYREGSRPRWSPDGKLIAFNYDRDIWVMNVGGGELRQITATDEITESLASFSSDGKSIVYASDEGTGGEISPDVNIWYANVDGTNKTQVTALDSWDSWPAWTSAGIYFQSGRGADDAKISRIWKIAIAQ